MQFVTDNAAYLITGAIVLLALLLAVFVFRSVGGSVKGRRGQRLAISEYHEIDQTRRLVLIRRDNKEHLLLIGGSQDLVVEEGIEGADVPLPQEKPSFFKRRATAPAAEADDEPGQPAPARTAPRPAVFGDRPPLRAVRRDDPRLPQNRPYDAGNDS